MMKQIFDGLREQITTNLEQCKELRENALDKATETGYGHRIDVYNRVLRYINEAEAKWEAECCEWKPYKTCIHTRETSCGHIEEYKIHYKYCCDCGKPIKIVEVE